MRSKRLAMTCAILGVLALPGSALAAGDEAVKTLNEIDAALVAEPSAPPALNIATFDLPVLGSEAMELAGGTEMGLPAEGRGVTVENTTLFDAAGTDDAQIALQSVAGGTRALINIDNAHAPERFAFPMSGEVASLRKNGDGSVAAYDSKGELVGGFAAPWARDANGADVSTHFEVDGTTLTQVISHRSSDVAYGVTADPIWLGLAIRACVRVACWRWMPNYVRTEYMYGHITSSVRVFLGGWFCRQTWVC